MTGVQRLTSRVRVPVSTRITRYRRNGRLVRRPLRRQRMSGGFLPALVPIIAAAIGAVPGIASVALQASRR